MRQTAGHLARAAVVVLAALLLVYLATPADHLGSDSPRAAAAHPDGGTGSLTDAATLTPLHRHPQPRPVDAAVHAWLADTSVGAPPDVIEDTSMQVRPGGRSNPARAGGTRAPPA